ncbi:putative nuclease HARBI1 [Pseudorasbora parva]|uniref:putative nuclease HARBI1 n=1 Tax=Pseudorasbora parva TaxID=51549 RepID=UPI00351E9C07
MACPFDEDPVDVEAQIIRENILGIALRFFASGHFLYSVGDSEHVGKATVCRAVRTVCLALKQLLPTFVQFPGHKPLLVIKGEFHRVAGFPNVIGCIDGTHIPIKAPSINEGDYVNRKSIHSINVQVICEATQIITNVEAKWPGSVHDARIFRESSLCQTFQQGQYNGYLLGDRGYPCLPYLMTPYPEPGPGPQTRFNLAHSRTRAKVEMTIGILKSRFQCLRGLRVIPERACDIIVACVVLHNMRLEPPIDGFQTSRMLNLVVHSFSGRLSNTYLMVPVAGIVPKTVAILDPPSTLSNPQTFLNAL